MANQLEIGREEEDWERHKHQEEEIEPKLTKLEMKKQTLPMWNSDVNWTHFENFKILKKTLHYGKNSPLIGQQNQYCENGR